MTAMNILEAALMKRLDHHVETALDAGRPVRAMCGQCDAIAQTVRVVSKSGLLETVDVQGRDMAALGITGVKIAVPVNGLAEVQLLVDPTHFVAEVDGVVTVNSEASAALKALGWTAPEGSRGTAAGA